MTNNPSSSKPTEQEIYARFAERYAAQEVPWDAELPPQR